MEITKIQQEIVEEFSFFDNWEDKYSYIIDLGKNIPLISDEFKTDQYLIEGCQSRVWLYAEHKNDRVYFYADSDAIITKGIIAVLIRAFSGQSAEDILSSEVSFIDRIGLKEHLSPTRANGLVSMISQMKLYAQAFQLKK